MELLDIVDENNNLTGEILDREIVHEKGFLHREAGVIILNKQGQILLEKRAPTKRRSPNKWALCAGHIASGENPDIAMIREMQEEIGVELCINDLEFVKIIKRERKYNDKLFNNTFLYIYLWETDKKEQDFIVQKEELSEVKFFDIEEVKNSVKIKDENFAFSNEKYIIDIINIVEEKIKK